jgi:hypothetical protein
MLSARRFFRDPRSNEAFLREHGISYVVASKVGLLLGYTAPPGHANIGELDAAPFLQRVMVTRSAIVYRVLNAHPGPVSPLLKGPVLHCIRTPVHF